MKLALVMTLTLSTLALSGGAQAGSLFSFQNPGRDVVSFLYVPVSDTSLAPQAQFRIEKLNVLLKYDRLIVRFRLPNALVTDNSELTFEGRIEKNIALLRGDEGVMLCRVREKQVTCRLRISANQTNLELLEKRLRAWRPSEVTLNNQLDVARIFNANALAFVGFKREDAGLRYEQ